MSAANPAFSLWCDNFAPGFLDTPEPDRLPLGATPDARNAWFSSVDAEGVTGARRAIMGKRPGSRLLNATAIAAGKAVDGGEFRRSGAASELLALCDGGLYKYDGAGSFGAALGSGWTAGNPGRFTTARGNAYVYDGAYMRRWNGTSLLEVGSAEPTSITNMTGSGTGVTGTYVAVYTWYDAATEHHSSPSAETAAFVAANQSRVHTKPGSAAPAWATHWGVWVKRTDTSELNLYFVANVAIGTATLTEATSDIARRVPIDLPNENDPPPAAWALLEEWRGWGIGVLPSADDYYISRRGDLQSWHPRNKFPVAKGDGENLTAVRKFGTNLLLQKPHSTHRLVGDRVPFELETVHSTYGCVSQEAGIEVDGRYYAWDRVRGPYVTDLVSFRPLGDGRIADLLSSINLSSLAGIRAVHAERHNLIVWCVPTTGSTRLRTLLAYNYLLGTWLPPITGLEYRSVWQFTTSSGDLGVYAGDMWGRVYELFTGAVDGPPSGTLTATVTTAAAGTVTAGAAAFYTTGSGLAGMPCAVISASSGRVQWRTLSSNTGTQLTIDTVNGSPFSPVPVAGDTIVVGGIDWYWWTPLLDMNTPQFQKQLHYLHLAAQSTTANVSIEVKSRFNGAEAIAADLTLTFPTGSTAGVWGVSLWGRALWGGAVRAMKKANVPRTVFSAQFRIANLYPNQPVQISQYGVTGDAQPGRPNPGPTG